MEDEFKNIINGAKMSIWINLAFAGWKFMLGMMAMSFFLCINAMYNVGVALAKLIAVRTYNTLTSRTLSRKSAYDLIYKRFFIMGAIVLIFSVIYMTGSIRLFLGADDTQYSLILALAIATFTFIELTIAIVGMIKSRKVNRPIVEALELINISSSLILLALTQTALLSILNVNLSTYNGIASMVFGSLAGLIGIYMILHSCNMLAGEYYKILIKRASGVLKRFGYVVVSYDIKANTLFVTDLTEVVTDLTDDNKVKRVKSKPQKVIKLKEKVQPIKISERSLNGNKEFLMSKTFYVKARGDILSEYNEEEFIENNSKISILNVCEINNENVLYRNNNESDLSDINLNNISADKNNLYTMMTHFVRYSKKEINSATKQQRLQMAKKVIHNRYQFNIEYHNDDSSSAL